MIPTPRIVLMPALLAMTALIGLVLALVAEESWDWFASALLFLPLPVAAIAWMISRR